MSQIGSTLRFGLAVVAAAGALAAGSGASAANIFLDKAEMFTPATAYISGPNYSRVWAYDGPVLFTANWGTAASPNTFQFLGFCVDLFDDINVGVNSPMTENLKYHDGALTTNNAHDSSLSAHGHLDLITLTQTQKDEISALVNFGAQLWRADSVSDPSHLHMSDTLIDQLGGVQGAIWKVENPAFTITGGPPVNGWGGPNEQSAVTGYINTYSSQAFLSTLPTGKIDTVFATDNPLHQAFAFAVPEPSTWAMMIMGFGAMGAALRRRRAQLAYA